MYCSIKKLDEQNTNKSVKIQKLEKELLEQQIREEELKIERKKVNSKNQEQKEEKKGYLDEIENLTLK